MSSQINKILNLLFEGRWVCTSAMYGLYISDPRRRLVDIRERGYVLESKRCELHDYHRGGSKMWRLVAAPPDQLPEVKNGPNSSFRAIASETPKDRATGILERKKAYSDDPPRKISQEVLIS